MTDTPRDRLLTVTGHGRAAVPPDEAEVVLGVEVIRPTAGEARQVAAEAMSKVIAALRARGLGDDAIRTADLSLGPELDYGQGGTPKRIGFRLTNRVSARIRELDTVAAVVDDAIAAGATSLDGVTFRVADEGEARRAALTAAVEDARASAQALAAAAGVGLGPVVGVRESAGGGMPPSPRLAMMEAKAADTPVMAGSTEIRASAEVTWRLTKG